MRAGTGMGFTNESDVLAGFLRPMFGGVLVTVALTHSHPRQRLFGETPRTYHAYFFSLFPRVLGRILFPPYWEAVGPGRLV